MDLRVIDRPESMELQFLLIPLACYLHFIVRLIANHMINEIQIDRRQFIEQRIFALNRTIAGQKYPIVTVAFDERVRCVAILKISTSESIQCNSMPAANEPIIMEK